MLYQAQDRLQIEDSYLTHRSPAPLASYLACEATEPGSQLLACVRRKPLIMIADAETPEYDAALLCTQIKDMSCLTRPGCDQRKVSIFR
jgi:hypothetical protein